MKANSRVQGFLRELRLPREERDAARAERHAEQEMRSHRDSSETADRRLAAVEAERRRASMHGDGGVAGM
jgi:hypothetical protein